MIVIHEDGFEPPPIRSLTNGMADWRMHHEQVKDHQGLWVSWTLPTNRAHYLSNKLGLQPFVETTVRRQQGRQESVLFARYSEDVSR